ncbi:MAG: type II secretion system protein [Patescibacteria group bacterium]|nr:type II secretion system protein [Patescibacteria group bacterium]
MISLKKRNQGFTIVELLIVIVVIGILAALVITTYSGIQAKARNGKRSSDINAVQTQLEGFYSQNGYYPSLADLNSKTWRATNMKSLDKGALVDPGTNCDPDAVSTCVAAAPAAKIYSYAVTDASNASCETTDTNCAQYTLTATYEGSVNNQTTYVKKNLD